MKSDTVLLYVATVLFWLAAVNNAPAYEMEISYGQSQYTKSDNGIWWQAGPAADGFYDQFDLKPKSFSIGVTDYLTDGVRWRAGYTHLGEVTSFSKAVPNDHNYNGVDGCVGKCLPMAYWYGRGYVDGFYLTASPEYKTGNWVFAVEGGLWLFKPDFTMMVTDIYDTHEDTSPRWVINQHKNGYEFGAVMGASIGFKNTSIAFTMYKSESTGPTEGDIAIYKGYTQNIAIRYRF